MAKKNKWTVCEDNLIIDEYLKAPKSKRLSLRELTSHVNWTCDRERSQDAVRSRAHTLRRALQREGTIGRQQMWFDGMKVGYFDIETYGFKANFGLMLSWAMYQVDGIYVDGDGTLEIPDDGVTKYDALTRKDAIDPYKLDRKITKSLLKAIDEVDLVVGYYSTRFDVPFVRTRSAMWGFSPMLYQEKYHYDMWFTVRSLYSLSRNTLEQACAIYGIDGKTHVDYALWDRARLGEQKAMDYILDHNIADVEILAELHRRVSGQRPLTRRSL